MRKDENFSLALDLKICNSLWASAIKLQDALRFTMPELLSDTHSGVRSPKPESHSLLTVLPRTACARTQSYSTYSWKTRRCVFFSFLFIFFDGGGVERERGWGIFNLWPPLSSPVKDTSFSSKNKNCDPCPWHDGHIDVPNQSRGSWTVVFNSLFCFNIVQYSRVTATNTFISQTQFCGFSPLFFA